MFNLGVLQPGMGETPVGDGNSQGAAQDGSMAAQLQTARAVWSFVNSQATYRHIVA